MAMNSATCVKACSTILFLADGSLKKTPGVKTTKRTAGTNMFINSLFISYK